MRRITGGSVIKAISLRLPPQWVQCKTSNNDVFVARYVPCYADLDTSTGAGTLDIFDFLAFQNAFVLGELAACDCDTSTGWLVCDIFDFLCFQSAFVNGCP